MFLRQRTAKWPLEITGRLEKDGIPKYLKVSYLFLIPGLLIVFCFLHTFFFGCVELCWLFMHGLIFTLCTIGVIHGDSLWMKPLNIQTGGWWNEFDLSFGVLASAHFTWLQSSCWPKEAKRSEPTTGCRCCHSPVRGVGCSRDITQGWFLLPRSRFRTHFLKVEQGQAFFFFFFWIFRRITADSKHILQSEKVNDA